MMVQFGVSEQGAERTREEFGTGSGSDRVGGWRAWLRTISAEPIQRRRRSLISAQGCFSTLGKADHHLFSNSEGVNTAPA